MPTHTISVDQNLTDENTGNVRSRPYRSYIATISQTGTDVPTVNVFENSIDGTATWNYGTIATYYWLTNIDYDPTKVRVNGLSGSGGVPNVYMALFSGGGTLMGYYGISHYAETGNKLAFEVRFMDTSGNQMELSAFNFTDGVTLCEFMLYA